ncbi:MAG: beta/gamma crystallin family protein [Pleurocapsa minor HA4230-MV1]|jgi:chromosome segregation and condensation protein ScpB|nr:beta/gamma crystallin family protein [Pleurocapsa minor HA4230-MV1]
MTKINNQSNRLDNINFVQDLDNESAAAVSGGKAVPDVILYSKKNRRGKSLQVNDGIADLSKDNFDDSSSSVVVNSGTWRLYTEPNFKGQSIDVESDTARDLPGRFNNSISSLKSI